MERLRHSSNTAQVVVVQVAQAAGLVTAYGAVASAEGAGSADLHGKYHAACGQVVFVFGDAVGFDFFLIPHNGL
jgi:hypothetical protein